MCVIDVEGVRSIFSNPFEFLLFSEIWTTPDEQFEAIPCSIFAVKLRKCFADYETSPDSPSARRRGEEMMTGFFLGVKCSFKSKTHDSMYKQRQ